MRDFLPEDVRRREYVIGVMGRRVYERYGFEPLETPAVENIETLLGKYGDEGDKPDLQDPQARRARPASGQADLALRYDLTVPLARVVAEYRGKLPKDLQALPDAAGVARRPAAEGPLPRVLPVRRRRARLDDRWSSRPSSAPRSSATC
jgi:histidyl-tRNA synthetase